MEASLPFGHPTTEYFWKGVANDELVLRRCTVCGVVQHPPQGTPVCGTCHESEFEEIVASGRGTVYTWIESRHPSGPDDVPSRIAAVIELEEGVRLVSNIVGAGPGQVCNEARVRVCFTEVNGVKLPQFELVEAELGEGTQP